MFNRCKNCFWYIVLWIFVTVPVHVIFAGAYLFLLDTPLLLTGGIIVHILGVTSYAIFIESVWRAQDDSSEQKEKGF